MRKIHLFLLSSITIFLNLNCTFGQTVFITPDNSTTYARYNLSIEHVPFAYPELEQNSFIRVVSGRNLNLNLDVNPPLLQGGPYLDSDLKIYENGGGTENIRDTLIISYHHPDTSFVINYAFQLTATASGCNEIQDFYYEYINSAPTFLDQIIEVDEGPTNGEIIGSVDATDENPTIALTYTLLNATPANMLNINPVTGVISVVPGVSLDFESTNQIVLETEVSDGVNQTTAMITVRINDVDEAPEGDASLSVDIPENSPQNSMLLTLPATDPEGAPVTFSMISESTAGVIALDPTTGIITLIDSAHFDHETNGSFVFTTAASDGLNQLETTTTITITNVNEEPSGPSTFEVNVAENTPPGTVLGNIAGQDPDGDNLSYSITASSVTGAIQVASNGDLSVLTEASFDFEQQQTITATVEVTDGEFIYNTSISLTIENINESPSMAIATFEVDNTTPVGTAIGTVEVTDPESDPITFNIVSDPDNLLSIDASTGELTLANAITVSESQTYTFRVSASDGTLSTTADQSLLINYVPPPLATALPESMKVYPNPVEDFLYLEIEDLTANSKIYIHGIDGRKMAEFIADEVLKNKGLSMSNYQSGTYLLTIETGGKLEVIKIQKK